MRNNEISRNPYVLVESDQQESERQKAQLLTTRSVMTVPMNKEELAGFFIAGLLNNASYVIMNAGAKNISPSMVGLVYVCNVVPSFLVKLSGPYWFHLVPYRTRIFIASIIMAIAFITVAIGTAYGELGIQLFGVVLVATQSGFGEASFLALSAFYDSRKALTAWSSGTGCAGIIGYAWVVIFTLVFDVPFEVCLYCALILPVLFWLNFVFLVKPPVLARDLSPDDTSAATVSTNRSTVTKGLTMDIINPMSANGANETVTAGGARVKTRAAVRVGDSEGREHRSAAGTQSGSDHSSPDENDRFFANRKSFDSSYGRRSFGIPADGSTVAGVLPVTGLRVRGSATAGSSTSANCADGDDVESINDLTNSMGKYVEDDRNGKEGLETPGLGGIRSDSYTAGDNSGVDLSSGAAEMTVRERIANTIALWPYMVPLFVVYFAEYAAQSGVWAAIGFPVHSTSARNEFYDYSNWVYQVGVLVSRSSGLVYKADMKALWTFPAIQVGLLLFFILDAYYMWWYDWSLLLLCFIVGLLGGAVYVGGFSLIAESVDPRLKEFSLSAASIADGVGIAFSNVAGIFIQQALYKYHNISDDD